MNNSFSRPRWLPALAALIAAFSGGCLPPGIAWFPDSTGFVYTGGKDKTQLTVFEVGQKKGRALPIKAGNPAWPAVSPDGKRIAVAWTVRGDDQIARLTVLVIDRGGKVLHRSREFSDLSGGIVQVWWSPRGDKLLISEEFWARLYDLKTEKLTRLPGPAVTFGTTAVRPDGKAFLVHNWEEEYRLVDWDGKVQTIKPGFAALVKDDRDERRVALRLPLHAIDSGWDMQVATVAWASSRFRIDTDKRSLTIEDWKLSRNADGEPVRISHSFPGGATVRQIHPLDEGLLLPRGGPRIEVVRPGKAPEVLVKKAGFCMFFPSPDSKLLAVRWAEDICAMAGASKKEDRILVLNAQGEVVADLKVGE